MSQEQIQNELLEYLNQNQLFHPIPGPNPSYVAVGSENRIQLSVCDGFLLGAITYDEHLDSELNELNRLFPKQENTMEDAMKAAGDLRKEEFDRFISRTGFKIDETSWKEGQLTFFFSADYSEKSLWDAKYICAYTKLTLEVTSDAVQGKL